MNFVDGAVAAMLDWAAHGLTRWAWWQVLLFTLAVTHVTIAAVTIYLHRSQAHRSLELGPVPSHFFRFWLWLTTGMVTKQWVAIHRKHHAKCETPEDPHSPQTRGLKTVMWRGAELYRAEAKVAETMAKYGHNTPDDWVERHVYGPRSVWGVSLMMVIDLLLFGALGLAVWAIQMVWIPFWAAGVVNGIGHFWGYRNFEAVDASTNVSPWGVIIGGEELHNNHHTYPTSAKFSIRPYEFDIGWGYIRALELLGWAKVRKVAPQWKTGPLKPQADAKTLEAVITHRYEVMAHYAKELRRACAAELARLKQQGGAAGAVSWSDLRLAERWLHRDQDKIPSALLPRLQVVVDGLPALNTLVAMREELRQVWTRTNVSAEQLLADLQDWCRRAEASGIEALRQFSLELRSARA
ncbi:DesA family fatty acid desaturase [Ideonella livida]|uniref:Acyl-CoA desaturase n=1 Tax=Ideonella livida TaxID=2707176 RepID=A0A7C9TGK0_9BURK|nr:fatty acid desaturase [Ideonella livida]NDY89680.1 acyl-CoA desaturase [Ideonella livida]